MDDDFNTPEALGVLFELSHIINKEKAKFPKRAAKHVGVLKHLGAILGLLQQKPEDFLQSKASDSEHADIEKLIKTREEARAGKDWALADEVRDKLTAMGVSLEDTPNGTLWRKM